MLAVSWNVMSLTADDRCNALRQTKRMGGVLFLIIHACQGGYPACLYHEHFNVHHNKYGCSCSTLFRLLLTAVITGKKVTADTDTHRILEHLQSISPVSCTKYVALVEAAHSAFSSE